jgi:hypothetical protein
MIMMTIIITSNTDDYKFSFSVPAKPKFLESGFPNNNNNNNNNIKIV